MVSSKIVLTAVVNAEVLSSNVCSIPVLLSELWQSYYLVTSSGSISIIKNSTCSDFIAKVLMVEAVLAVAVLILDLSKWFMTHISKQ